MKEPIRNKLALGFLIAFVVTLVIMAVSCNPARKVAQEQAEPTHQVLRTPDVGRPPAPHTVAHDTPHALDTPSASGQKPSLFRRIFPAKAPETASTSGQKKCKNCHFTTIVGDNNKVAGDTRNKDGAISWEAAANNAGKKAQQATGEGTLNNAGPNTQQTITTGDGNQVAAKKQDEIKEAPDWRAALTGPVGKVLGLLLLVGAAIGGYRYWQARKAKQLIS